MDLARVLQVEEEAVVGGKIFGYLPWNDLLRLRRSCKDVNKITNAYLKANPSRAPEIEINEEKDKSFGAFLTLGIPTTKLFLNNSSSGHHFYEGAEEEAKIRQFLEDHGSLITDLRVTQLTLANGAVCRDRELAFMESLPNLKTFEASYCVSGGKSASELEKEITEPYLEHLKVFLTLPKTFKCLESIKIGLDQEPNVDPLERKKRTRDFLMQCPKLKRISMPVSWNTPFPENDGLEMDITGTIAGDLVFFLSSVDDRPNSIFKEKADVQLEWIDFENCHEGYGTWLQEKYERALPLNWHSSYLFLKICLRANKSGLKMKNVSPFWYYSRYTHENISLMAFGHPVYSLVGLDPVIVEVPMPNLEKLTIPSTKVCLVGERKPRHDWPQLKCLDITVDGNEGECWDFEGAMSAQDGATNGMRAQDTNDIFAFLFAGIKREGLEELRIRFVEGMMNGGRGRRIPEVAQNALEKFLKGKRGTGHLWWEIREELYVPSLEMIVECCPNLKRVVLGNWQGSNQDLLRLWNGLGEGLEEVELGNCVNVADFMFFGEDKGKPVFLKLKNLKKLSLKGLDKMGKVTDLLFTEILAKMKLKQILITSEKPVDKVTKVGISALLEGPFAETICKFPFRGWSLADVTQEEFQEIGKKFRSYNML